MDETDAARVEAARRRLDDVDDRCAASEPATEWCSNARSGGRAVVRTGTGAVASVGVAEAGAFAPTAGTGRLAATWKTETAWIFAPSGSARNQYLPGRGMRK